MLVGQGSMAVNEGEGGAAEMEKGGCLAALIDAIEKFTCMSAWVLALGGNQFCCLQHIELQLIEQSQMILHMVQRCQQHRKFSRRCKAFEMDDADQLLYEGQVRQNDKRELIPCRKVQKWQFVGPDPVDLAIRSKHSTSESLLLTREFHGPVGFPRVPCVGGEGLFPMETVFRQATPHEFHDDRYFPKRVIGEKSTDAVDKITDDGNIDLTWETSIQPPDRPFPGMPVIRP